MIDIAGRLEQPHSGPAIPNKQTTAGLFIDRFLIDSGK